MPTPYPLDPLSAPDAELAAGVISLAEHRAQTSAIRRAAAALQEWLAVYPQTEPIRVDVTKDGAVVQILAADFQRLYQGRAVNFRRIGAGEAEQAIADRGCRVVCIIDVPAQMWAGGAR